MQNRYTPKNVRSFIQGYSRYYYDNIFGLAEHIKQQVIYRLYTCKDSCLKQTEEDKIGRCEECKCPTIQKAYATKSCNLEKFPDLMDRKSWESFMEEKNIKENIISMQEEVNNYIRENVK